MPARSLWPPFVPVEPAQAAPAVEPGVGARPEDGEPRRPDTVIRRRMNCFSDDHLVACALSTVWRAAVRPSLRTQRRRGRQWATRRLLERESTRRRGGARMLPTVPDAAIPSRPAVRALADGCVRQMS